VTSAPLEDGKQSDHRPPGYRRQKGKLFEAAVAAYRRRKQAGALTSRALACEVFDASAPPQALARLRFCRALMCVNLGLGPLG
jgi:hypothetical protein